MNLIIFEDNAWSDLLPLTWLRTPAELRCGRRCLAEKLTHALHTDLTDWRAREHLAPALAERYQLREFDPAAPTLLFNSRALCTTDQLTPPPSGAAWLQDGRLIAAHLPPGATVPAAEQLLDDSELGAFANALNPAEPPAHVLLIQYPWDLLSHNEAELRRECNEGNINEGRVYSGAHLLNPAAIHIGNDAVVKPGVVLDAEDGPIHIAPGAEVQPNAVIIGPSYIGPQTIIRPTALLRENNAIGPVCRLGGEIEGSILHSFVNKQHDGFLGHSYLGSWVNLGADTVTSDLKNTYGSVRVALNAVPIDSGQRFIGSFIGDHTKTGINTTLPTGCVLGVATNIFLSATAPKFVPSFGWLTDAGLAPYRIDKALELARTVLSRRKLELSDHEANLLRWVKNTGRDLEIRAWEDIPGA